MEEARSLLASQIYFQNPIYLVLYAGEEVGDYGSIAVVDYFKQNNIPVKAVMNLDMDGFAYNNDQTMYLETGCGMDAELTAYLQQLIQFYVKQQQITLPPNCHGDSDDQMNVT